MFRQAPPNIAPIMANVEMIADAIVVNDADNRLSIGQIDENGDDSRDSSDYSEGHVDSDSNIFTNDDSIISNAHVDSDHQTDSSVGGDDTKSMMDVDASNNLVNDDSVTTNVDISGQHAYNSVDGKDAAADDVTEEIVPKVEIVYIKTRQDSIDMFEELFNDVDPLPVANKNRNGNENGDDDPIKFEILGGNGFPLPFQEDADGLIKRKGDVFSGNIPFKESVISLLNLNKPF